MINYIETNDSTFIFVGNFTDINDIVEGIERLLPKPPKAEGIRHKVYNIGNNNSEKLMDFIRGLEKALSNVLGRDVEFEKTYKPIKPGDVPNTYAPTDALYEAVPYNLNSTSLFHTDFGKEFEQYLLHFFRKI